MLVVGNFQKMLQIGDIILLRPSCFNAEFEEMKHSLNWSQKYLYEDEFKYVGLFYPNLQKRGEHAKTFWGNSQSQVIKIEYDNERNPLIVYTNLFWISFNEALLNNEIRILKSNGENKVFKSELKLLEDLEYFEQIYLEKVFDILERENNKSDFYKYGLFEMIRERKFSI